MIERAATVLLLCLAAADPVPCPDEKDVGSASAR
jgi:hypothetical protein